jgi:hypothetical protein
MIPTQQEPVAIDTTADHAQRTKLRERFDRMESQLAALGFRVPFEEFAHWTMEQFIEVVRFIPLATLSRAERRAAQPLAPLHLQRWWCNVGTLFDDPDPGLREPTPEPKVDRRFDELVGWFCATLGTDQLAVIAALALGTLDMIDPPHDHEPTTPIEDALMELCTKVEEAIAKRTTTVAERATRSANRIVEAIISQNPDADRLAIYRVIRDELCDALEAQRRGPAYRSVQ